MRNNYLPPVITTPSSLQITSISQSLPAVIAVEIADPSTELNTYESGQLIRVNIPKPYGMQQMANKTVQVISNDGINISVNIDSTQFDPFAIPSTTGEAPPTIAPSGSRNVQYDNTTRLVPFQSASNRGN